MRRYHPRDRSGEAPMARIGKGYTVDKTGKIVKKTKKPLDASAQIRQRTSKKIRVVKRGT